MSEAKRNTPVLSTVAAYRAGRLVVGILAASIVAGVPEARALDAGVWVELGRVQTLEAEFVQIQKRAILKSPLQSEGTVRYARPDTLDWVVEAPSRSSFSLAKGVATMTYPDLGMRESIDLASVPDANRLATSLLVWLRADGAAVERDFVATYGPSTATLVPRDPKLKGLLSSIELSLVAGPWRVRQVVLTEPDGDRVEIRFHEVRIDGVPVSDG